MTKISYEYSLFMTEDGEVATGVCAEETAEHASSFLAGVLMDNLDLFFEKNPNRVISFIIQTSEQSTSEET